MWALLSKWLNTQLQWPLEKPDFCSLLWPNIKHKRTYNMMVMIQPVTHHTLIGAERVTTVIKNMFIISKILVVFKILSLCSIFNLKGDLSTWPQNRQWNVCHCTAITASKWKICGGVWIFYPGRELEMHSTSLN